MKKFVSPICVILVLLSFLAMYYLHNALINKENEKEVLDNDIVATRDEKTKLENALEEVENNIRNHSPNDEVAIKDNELKDEEKRLNNEKKMLEMKRGELAKLEQVIKEESYSFNERLKKLKSREAELESENNTLKKSEEDLKKKPNPEKDKQLKAKRDELSKKQNVYDNDKKQCDNEVRAFTSKKDEHKKAWEEFNKRQKTYEDDASKFNKEKDIFNREYAGQKGKLDSLNEQKLSISVSLSSKNEKYHGLTKKYNDTCAQIGRLKKLILIFFIIALLLIIFLLAFIILGLKNRKLKQKTNISCVSSTSVKEEGYSEAERVQEDDMNKRIDDLTSKVNYIGKEYGRYINELCERFGELEKRIGELEKGVEAPEKRETIEGLQMKNVSSTEPKGKETIISKAKTSLSHDVIGGLYLSNAERVERNKHKEVIQNDVYLNVDEIFFNKALDRQGEEHDATLIVGGEYNSAEFIMISGNLLYFNFYCYNENKTFPKFSNDAMKVRRCIFDFEEDECGKIMQCSPARVQKVEDGRYMVIEKGAVLIKNET